MSVEAELAPVKLYRHLTPGERRRDLAEFLKWQLRRNKGSIVEVSLRRYNQWPGGYGPLSRGDAPIFVKLLEEAFKAAHIRPKFFRRTRGNYGGKRYYLSKPQVKRLIRWLERHS